MKKLSFENIINDENYITLVNKVYHDIESQFYDASHPEILNLESTSWQEILNQINTDLSNASNRVFLDVGTGTGFVVEQLSNYLSSDDVVIFSDISSEMLEVCKKRFTSFNFKKVFLQGNSTSISLPDSSVNVITINSVLHHIANIEKFFSECERLLTVGGFLIIKHEPNKRFGNSVLSYLYRFLLLIKRARRAIKRKKNRTEEPIYIRTIQDLQNKHQIDISSINESELHSIVDIHSPTAGGSLDSRRGFDPFEFHSRYFNNLATQQIRTYGFFGKINEEGSWMRQSFSSILKMFFPKNGYFFDIVLKKYEK